MKFNKNNFLRFSIGMTAISPIFAIISCSSTTKENQYEVIKQKTELQNFLNSNTDAIVGKRIGNDKVKNFIDIRNWNNFDDFWNILNEYFTVSDDLKTKLTENNNDIYNQIKKISIQPKKGTTNLTIIFYLKNAAQDGNTVSKDIANGLSSSFAYQHEISLSKNYVINNFLTKDEFNKLWNEWKNNKNINSMVSLLKTAFGISATNAETIANNANYSETKYYSISLVSSYIISISILDEGIKNGCIFTYSSTESNIGEQQVLNINSNYLVNE